MGKIDSSKYKGWAGCRLQYRQNDLYDTKIVLQIDYVNDNDSHIHDDQEISLNHDLCN